MMIRNEIDIIDAIEAPDLFQPIIGENQSTWFAWKVFLKAVYGLPMDDREFEIYQKHTGRPDRPGKRADEVFCICGRKGGKSFILSLVATYTVLLESFWREKQAIGERVIFPVVAQDREGSRTIFSFVSAFLNCREIFKKQIVTETKDEIELRGNIFIQIRTASYRSIRGPKYIGAAADELAFWRDSQTAANPASEILQSIRPGLVEGGILFGISSAFNRAGVLYEEYTRNWGVVNSDTLIWHAGTLDMNPTYSQKKIDKAKSKDQVSASAEYDSLWRDDLSSLFSSLAIEELIINDRKELSFVPGNQYFAFCDPSGGRHDAMALAIGHYDTGTSKVVIDLTREVLPGRDGFQPAEVVKEFCYLMKGYAVSQVMSDRYAGAWVEEAFKKEGVYVVYSDLPASELYLNMLPEVNNRAIELPDNNRLKAQLQGLMRKTITGGRDKVITDPGLDGHADLANAVAGVIFQIVRGSRVIGGGDTAKLYTRKGDASDKFFSTNDPNWRDNF